MMARICHSKRARTIAVGIFLIAMGIFVDRLYATEDKSTAPQAQEPTGIARWINSDPLTLESLRGKVVVLHFWTFGCINCQHNLPFYNRWQKLYADKDLQIIGIHTPETDGEAVEDNVVAQVKQLGITYPVAIDNDKATWQAYQNRCWPSIYLIDKAGRVRYRWEGELEYQKAGGDKKVRAIIKQLLAEQPEQ